MFKDNDTLYTIIYLDYIKELKNMGVDVDNLSEKTIMKWLNNHLKNIEKVYTPLKIALFNKKLMVLAKKDKKPSEDN